MASAPLNSSALIECDFCSFLAEEAWYLSHGHFEFLICAGPRIESIDAVAGRVAACPVCYPLVKAKDLKGLIARFFERHTYSDEKERTVTKAYLIGYQGGILKNLLNREKHVTWRSPKPVIDRFSTHRCHKCGEDIPFDTTTYDRSIELKCPKCGAKIDIIGKGPEVKTAANLS